MLIVHLLKLLYFHNCLKILCFEVLVADCLKYILTMQTLGVNVSGDLQLFCSKNDNAGYF